MQGIFFGIMYVGFAALLRFIPPVKINWFYGYRTVRSMKSIDAWHEGNRIFSFFLGIAGMLTILAGTALYLILHDQGNMPSIIAGLSLLIITLVVSEIILRRRFDRDGKRIK
jgi:uncharacterized membrane protein